MATRNSTHTPDFGRNESQADNGRVIHHANGTIDTPVTGGTTTCSDFETRVCREAWGGLGTNDALVPARAKVLIALVIDLVNCGDICFGSGKQVCSFQNNVDIAFQLGCSIETIEEALKLGAVYAGFNKGASAFGRFMEIVDKGETIHGTKVPARDPNAFLPEYDGKVPAGVSLSNNTVLGDPVLCARLYSISPVFGESVVRWAGEVWGCPLLSQKTKAFVTLVIDVVNCHTVGPGNPWGAHINMCVQHGATVAEIDEVLYFCCVYCGFNKSLLAIGAWKGIKEQGKTPFGVPLLYGHERRPVHSEVMMHASDTFEALFPQECKDEVKAEGDFVCKMHCVRIGKAESCSDD